jgi:hypothetical protein
MLEALQTASSTAHGVWPTLQYSPHLRRVSTEDDTYMNSPVSVVFAEISLGNWDGSSVRSISWSGVVHVFE